MYKTPILLIIFNRADTALQVISRLREIKPQYLFVAADAARKHIEGEKEKCEWVRNQVLNAIDWECELKTLFQDENLGCGLGPATAITWFFDNVEQGIVLEDDIIPLKSFFPFMEEMLEKYKDNQKIMHIGGHSMGTKSLENNADYFFSAYNHWAWASWSRAWQKFDYKMLDLDNFLASGKIESYFESNTHIDFWKYIFSQVKSMASVWDYQWTYSIWNNGGLVILPKNNLCENIGYGDDSTHSTFKEKAVEEAELIELGFPLKHPSQIKQNKEKDAEMTLNLMQGPEYICPLTGKRDLRLITRIKIKNLIQKYQELLNIDVSSYFKNLQHLYLLESQSTGYRFYYPYQTAGDGSFYAQLQENDWYYMPWKWEHEIAAAYIQKGMKVLEAGSAKGDFLSRIKSDKEAHCYGVELNETAAEEARSKGLNVYVESIENHASKNKEQYDIVCSFQVLEHISQVKSFIQAKVDALKIGGKLIISVPNNESFIGHEFNILDAPPHHLGLWNTTSLKSLEQLFPVKVDKIYYEPIQEYHREWFNKITRLRSDKIVRNRFAFLPSLFQRILRKLLSLFFSISMKKGHSILVVYTKK